MKPRPIEMRIRLQRTSWCLCVFIASAALSSPAQTLRSEQTSQKLAKPLVPLLKTLRETTKIPLRLPSFIPYSDDPSSQVYSSIIFVNGTSYAIDLSFTPDCTGGNSCHLGSIRSAEGTAMWSEHGSPVHLVNGLTSYFTPASCGGAGCTDAELFWTQDGFSYSVSLKAGSRSELIRMAQSMIRSKYR